MNAGARRVVAVVAVAAAAALTGFGSRIGWAPGAAEHGVLRLSWRARSERMEVCRHRTPEEIEKLPVHMREDEVCERHLLPYRLRVTIGSALAIDRQVRAAGARQDRPLYVFQELSLAPGDHRIAVLFERQGLAPVEPPETHPEEHGAARTAPPRLTLDTSVNLSAGRVVLVTYDEDTRELRIKGDIGMNK